MDKTKPKAIDPRDLIDHDYVTMRDKIPRLAQSLVIAFLIMYPTFTVVSMIISIIGALFSAESDLLIEKIVFGISAAILAFLPVFPRVSVFVRKNQAIAATSRKGDIVVFGPGLHARYLTDTVTADDHYPLKIVTITFSGTIDTKDAEMIYSGKLLFKPSLRRLDAFVGVDEESIADAFSSYFESFMSSATSLMTGQEAREAVAYLTARTKAAFRLLEDTSPSDPKIKKFEKFGSIADADGEKEGDRENLEKRFGGVLVDSLIDDMDYSEEVRKAREAVAEAERIPSIIARMFSIELRDSDGNPKPESLEKMRQITDRPDFLAIVGRAMTMIGKATQHTIVTEGTAMSAAAAAISKWLDQNEKTVKGGA